MSLASLRLRSPWRITTRLCLDISAFQEVIEREAVIFARKRENKEEEREARNDVAAKVEERVVQKMAECDDDEYHAERDERIAGA